MQCPGVCREPGLATPGSPSPKPCLLGVLVLVIGAFGCGIVASRPRISEQQFGAFARASITTSRVAGKNPKRQIMNAHGLITKRSRDAILKSLHVTFDQIPASPDAPDELRFGLRGGPGTARALTLDQEASLLSISGNTRKAG
ncbi:hypothetical protein AK830_g8135 [Neonectria ditissima]|uniref:Uncharacterized protein n=1 Tax=Neonectria ditissima TaxID=78410 RepID=A0A0P7AKX9_9HYPO|nr:hypothetical protein AK830_g8135 [Neonectria ditissima]